MTFDLQTYLGGRAADPEEMLETAVAAFVGDFVESAWRYGLSESERTRRLSYAWTDPATGIEIRLDAPRILPLGAVADEPWRARLTHPEQHRGGLEFEACAADLPTLVAARCFDRDWRVAA